MIRDINPNLQRLSATQITPNQTYKKDLDELVKHKERLDWKGLRKQLKDTGIRHSTLMALMPAETSAQISNSTNGIEPPRSYISIKQSKHGVLCLIDTKALGGSIPLVAFDI